MVSNILRPGDKVEIRPVQQVAQRKANGTVPHVYKSMIQEVRDNGEIDISMPMEEGKYVLLHLGIRYEFIFYAQSNVLSCEGQVKERYKANNIYMLRIELKTPLAKVQRREFYRFPCIMDIRYYRIVQDAPEFGEGEEVLEMVEDGIPWGKTATVLDISGGGARIVSGEPFENNQLVLMELKLVTDSMDKEYSIKGRVLSSKPLDAPEPKYELRIEFIMKDNQVREDIIRYIFEEDRRKRKNENG